MEKLKTKLYSLWTLLVIVGVIAISVGVYAYSGAAPKVVVEGDYIEAQELAPEPELGAIPGNELQDNEWIVGGLSQIRYGKPMTRGTTTPCAIKTPSATSTLIWASASFRHATSAAYTVTMALNSNAYATGTATITQDAIFGAGSKSYLIASSSAGYEAINPRPTPMDSVIAPNQYFVVGIRGGINTQCTTATNCFNSLAGTCQAEFQPLE